MTRKHLPLLASATGSQPVVFAYALSGIRRAGALDTTNSNAAAAATNVNSSVTTTRGNEVVFSIVANGGTSISDSMAAEQQQGNTANSVGGGMGYSIIASPGAKSSTWNWTTATNATMFMAAFLADPNEFLDSNALLIPK